MKNAEHGFYGVETTSFDLQVQQKATIFEHHPAFRNTAGTGTFMHFTPTIPAIPFFVHRATNFFRGFLSVEQALTHHFVTPSSGTKQRATSLLTWRGRRTQNFWPQIPVSPRPALVHGPGWKTCLSPCVVPLPRTDT